MSKPNPNQGPQPPTVYQLDFSGKQAARARNEREAEADRQLAADPDFRSIQSRVAQSEEAAAREYDSKARPFLLGAIGIAGAAVGIDRAVSWLFNMQDVNSLPELLTHGVILGVGGVAAVVSGVIGMDHSLNAQESRVSAERHRSGRLY